MVRHPAECAWDLLNSEGCVQGTRCRFRDSHTDDAKEVKKRLDQSKQEWEAYRVRDKAPTRGRQTQDEKPDEGSGRVKAGPSPPRN